MLLLRDWSTQAQSLSPTPPLSRKNHKSYSAASAPASTVKDAGPSPDSPS